MAFSIIRAYMGPLFTAQTGFQKLMGGPISITGFPLNNFCVNHEVKGFFFNLKYAHNSLPWYIKFEFLSKLISFAVISGMY